MPKDVDPLSDLKKLNLPFNVDEVIPECHECIRDQLKKYKNYTYRNGRRSNGFEVDCKGIKKEVIPAQLKHKYSTEDIFKLRSILDPVFFSSHFIFHPGSKKEHFIPRDYQEVTLRCTSPRKVLRWSRRTGKTSLICVDIIHQLLTREKIRIILAAPMVEQIENIFVRVRDFMYANPALKDTILNFKRSPHELMLKNKSILKGFAAGSVSRGGDGTSIRGQDADIVYCMPAGTLVNDSEFSVRPIETLTLDNTVLGGDSSGVFVGDITQLGSRMAEVLSIPTWINTINCTPEHPLFDGEKDVDASNAKEVICSLYHKELRFYRRAILARLLGYVYGDGWLSNNQVGFSGQEADMEQIQTDLELLGDSRKTVYSRITENKERGIKGSGSQISSNFLYDLFKEHCPIGKKVFQQIRVPKYIMEGEPYLKYEFLSGLFSAEGTHIKYQKNNRTPRTIELNMRSIKKEWIDNWFKDICELLDRCEIGYSYKSKQVYDEELYDNYDRFVGYLSINNSKENIDKFVDKIGYCYSVEKTRSANIWKIFRRYEKTWNMEQWKKNRNILSETGTSSHVSNKLGIPKSTVKYHRKNYHRWYSEKLMTPEQLINKLTWKDGYVKLPIIRESVKTNNKKVKVYNLTSSASNRFFAGGLFTHNCEEMDYIAEEAIQGAILPLLSTSPHVKLVGFSTPLGFTTTPFYKLCNESPDYKEFHYTYRVLPWADEVEKQRHNMTEDKWNREYEATFADISAGVYKPKYIDSARKTYKYQEETRIDYWQYCMGVDWNEKHGAEIVVIGHDPYTRKFRVVEANHVGGAAFTQLNSVAKVVELFKKWLPEYIYVDAGNGSTNYELLLHMAKKAPQDDILSEMIYRVKKYDSGAKVEVNDIMTGEKVRKAAKPFMVDASIRMFEQRRIDISDSDFILEKQLRNYMIERYTESGVPKFSLLDSTVGDHRLDAFNLAVVAFQLEFTDLFKKEYIINIAIANNPLSPETYDEEEKEETTREIKIIKRSSNTSTTERKFNSKLDNNSLRLLKRSRTGWGAEEKFKSSNGFSRNRSRFLKERSRRSDF